MKFIIFILTLAITNVSYSSNTACDYILKEYYQIKATDDGSGTPSTKATDDGSGAPTTNATDDGSGSPSTKATDDGSGEKLYYQYLECVYKNS